MVVLQKYEGNGIIELLNLLFGFNPQTALSGL